MPWNIENAYGPTQEEAGVRWRPPAAGAGETLWPLCQPSKVVSTRQIRVRIQPERSLLRSPRISAYCFRALVKLSLGKFIVRTGTTGVG